MRELARADDGANNDGSLRNITLDDLLSSVSKLKESKVHCGFIVPKLSNVGDLD